LQFSEFGFYVFVYVLIVIFFNLLTVLNTLSTAIDDIIPYTSLVGGLNDKNFEFGSRGMENFQDDIHFPRKSFWVG
jgi:hypothetical protein